MYAIVDIAGQQFKVEKDQKIFVHRLETEEGNLVEFDQVLLIDNEKDIAVGQPVLEGALVTAKVLSHLKGDKVIVFKKKRRKGYQKLNGHRQYLSEILIQEIIEKGAKKSVPAPKVKAEPKAKAETAPVAEVVIEKATPVKAEIKVKKETVVKKAPAAKKETTAKAKPSAATKGKATAATKKPVVKKATSSKKTSK